MLSLLFSSLLFSSCYAKPFVQVAQFLNFINSSLSATAERDASWRALLERNGSRRRPMYVGRQDGLRAADKIDALFGQPKGVSFDQYAGYVAVDPIKGRALFYYFVEARHDPSSKPLILWLNGGPGCSALEFGAMLEIGPFRVNSDRKTLTENKAAWNDVANVIFLESPAGVGFSYSNTSSDYEIIGDKITADDSYIFLINWLERFPEYKTRDFFIAGESYAGHYVPQLATLIVENNEAKRNTIIQLKGIIMGNAYVDANTNVKATYDYYWTHALIGDETYNKIQKNCNFSATFQTVVDCKKAIDTADKEIGNIDAYGIYAPLCKGSSNNEKTSVLPDPCGDDYVDSYMNLVQVQKAFHVNGNLPYSWKVCSNYSWNDAPSTVLPSIQELMARGLRVWFYSGDQDSIVPVTSTKYSINMLRLPVESHWKAWSIDGEVGGYVVGYKGLTLVTVRGAGHLAPSYQPDRALVVFKAFLQGRF